MRDLYKSITKRKIKGKNPEINHISESTNTILSENNKIKIIVYTQTSYLFLDGRGLPLYDIVVHQSKMANIFRGLLHPI